MNTPLLKLQYLKDNPPEGFDSWSTDNLAQIEKWEKDLENLAKAESFYDQKTPKEIVERLVKEVSAINTILLDKEKRNDNTDFLFAQKDCFLWLLRLLAGNNYSERIKEIEIEIDRESIRFAKNVTNEIS